MCGRDSRFLATDSSGLRALTVNSTNRDNGYQAGTVAAATTTTTAVAIAASADN